MFSGEDFDGAGKNSIVLQERLHGPEVSAFALSDGANFILLPFAQDHKRLKDNDQGPNTGGVGAYCPLPASIVSREQNEKIRNIVAATIGGMNAEGTPYQGVLYVGLMLAEERGGDPVVIEYNARFGDPEAEVILTALSASGCDIANMLSQTAHGNLKAIVVPPLTQAALTVCLCAQGYPESPRKNDEIVGLNKTYPNTIVQYAGVAQNKETLVTSGGRVLYVTGTGKTIDEAAAAAYAAIGPDGIHFDGMQYRTDIGHQARTKKP
jgi:phosphoribosylamine--glycine ligase